MFRIRRIEWPEEGDLNVFVPGLMAAGILLSIVMLAADAAKWLWPSRGQRARAARIARKLHGRVNDLQSVATGAAPKPLDLEREPRGLLTSIALVVASIVATYAIVSLTIGAYSARTGSLAHRGWTLSGGLGIASVFAAFGLLALLNILPIARRPQWLTDAGRRWPWGRLRFMDDFEEVR